MLGYTDMGCGAGGSQIAGLVGSGNVLAVSTWQSSLDGKVAARQRLNRITRAGLRPIATGSTTIVSASTDRGRIAVVPLPTPGIEHDGYCDMTAPTSVAIYSVDGALLKRIETGGPVADVAITGNRLVVLRGPSTPGRLPDEFAVYDWPTGRLLHTWPVTPPHDFAVAGQLAVYSVDYRRQSVTPRNVHLLNLTTGKDVSFATTTNSRYRDVAISRRGLVYAVNPSKDTGPGKLVFVPTAKLLRF